MKPVVFIFVGRISSEKGVSSILTATEQLIDVGYTDFQVHFVGSGNLVSILTTHKLYTTHLFYHGRLPKEQTIDWIKKADYTLMPSLFLETFGLVALDSLACGVPVLGEKKGGLSGFIIHDRLSIQQNHSLFCCMKYVLNNTDPDFLPSLQKKAFDIASGYTSRQRIDRFGQLSKNCKKLFLLSDYAKDIGGIESYLFQVQSLLDSQGVNTQLYGKTTKVNGWWRKVDLLVAGANFLAAWRVYKKVTTEQFDLVRLHSVQRRLGRGVLAVLRGFKKTPVWCMYHDVGLLHPFPSAVYTEDQLETARTMWGYIAEGKKVWGGIGRYLGGFFLVVAKYGYSCRLLYRLGKVVDLHLVPSAYLAPYFQKKLPNGSKIEVFSHFVTHAKDV